VIDWSNQQVDDYLREHDLPYHPLREKGYVSVGDVHTTQRLEPGMREEQTRFFGLKRECGLHEDDLNDGSGI
jgi:phosphoadenosine phosphosulfate reductase